MIKRLLKMVELTLPEQRVIIFGICALLAFVVFTTYRGRSSNSPTPSTSDQPSPSPGIRP